MTTTITEERIAPIIDADAVQNAARINPDAVNMIYDRNIGDLCGLGASITAFINPSSTPILVKFWHSYGSDSRHLSIDDAKAIRDALTEAIAAREAIAGAL